MLDLYKLDSIDAMIERLSQQPSFIKEFVVELTVNVTEMFRDPTCWVALRQEVLPALLAGKQHIRIWHAGCSSGEEVLSMCILLQEMGMLDRVSIVATDIDHAIIEKAKTAVISLKHMELHKQNYGLFKGQADLMDYFVAEGNSCRFRQELLRQVEFTTHDLVRGPAFAQKFDLVLCRNVMIYFNQRLQNTVLHRMNEVLWKQGFLVIGAKESLIWCDIASKFAVVNQEEKIYRKIKD